MFTFPRHPFSRRLRQIKETKLFTYAAMERIVAKAHGVEKPEEVTKLESRIKHLQKLGVFRTSPGKGKKIDYTTDDIFFWAICLELIEIGLPPIVLISILARVAGFRLGKYLTSESAPLDLYLFIDCKFYEQQMKDIRTGHPYFSTTLTSNELINAIASRKIHRAIIVNLASTQAKLLNAMKVEIEKHAGR